MWELNTFMAELPLDNYALPKSLPLLNPHGIPIALCHQDWTSIKSHSTHPLQTQVNSWPSSYLLGLITCHLEHEWNDELTSSGDLVYLGAVPKNLTKIIDDYCVEALDTCRRHEDRARIQYLAKTIRGKWKKIQFLLRLKPQAIQRVISSQLGVYHKELKERQRKETEKREACTAIDTTTNHMNQSSPPAVELVATSPSGGDDSFITRTCHGLGCGLKNTLNNFALKLMLPTQMIKSVPNARHSKLHSIKC